VRKSEAYAKTIVEKLLTGSRLDYRDDQSQGQADFDVHFLDGTEGVLEAMFTNQRMTAQRSAFTMSGDSPLSLDEEFPELVQGGRLTKLVIPPDSYDDADRFIALVGLTAFSVYPDLEGIAMRQEDEMERTISDARRWYTEHLK
jgi:hypothetical protein